MSGPTEIELKLELDPADLARLAESPLLAGEGRHDDHLVSDYYDSAEGALAKAGFTLRIRRGAGGYVQTVKQEAAKAAGLFVRPEWERPVTRGKPQLDKAPFAGLVDIGTLQRVFTTSVDRSTRRLAIDDAAIEVALDRGELRAGRRRRPIAELELELKVGDPASLFALARSLDAVAPLQLGVRSKAERGQELAERKAPAAYKAEPVRLDRTMTGGAALAAIAAACLRHFRLNAPLVIADGGAEPIHQARVALRRLRSALASFRSLFAGDATGKRIAGELRWLAGALGRVRDLDVLIPRLRPADRNRIEAERAGALVDARRAIASARGRRLMLDLSEWLAVGAWRGRAAATAPIAPLAERILARHHRRIRRRGRHLSRLGDHRRHRVRIEAKKLRYATEFFAALWKGGKARRRRERFVGALEDLQTHLGALNDRVTAAELIARYDLAAPRANGSRRKLLHRAGRARHALLDAETFWT